jgi:hypothetical protein
MEHLSRKYDPTYHGSKLNHFVAEHCKKTMVVNNIDMIIYDYENKIMTFVESKHNNEPLRKGQKIMLNKLRELIPKNIGDWLTRILIIRGDPPYDTAILESVDGSHKKTLSKNELIKFINGQTR